MRPRAAVWDIDQCLVKFRMFRFPVAVEMVKEMEEAGYEIVFLTGRRTYLFWPQTKFLLWRLGIRYKALHTYWGLRWGGPPNYKRDRMKRIAEKWQVEFFFDDRQTNLDACSEWVKHSVLVDGKDWPSIREKVRTLMAEDGAGESGSEE